MNQIKNEWINKRKNNENEWITEKVKNKKDEWIK